MRLEEIAQIYKFRVKGFKKDSHLEFINRWFEEREFPTPIPEFLPPTGVVIYHAEWPICAGFLFKTDAGIATIGNLVSNPEIDEDIRRAGVNYMIGVLELMAREDGFKMITMATNIKSLGERIKMRDFVETDKSVSHFAKIFLLN